MSDIEEEKRIASGYDKNNASSSPGKRKIIIAFCFAILILFLILFFTFYRWDTSCGGFQIYVIDKSQINNGTIIHLTEDDFREFPKMAPIIRDGQYTTEKCSSSMYDSRNCLGKGIITCDDERRGVFGKYQVKTFNETTHSYFDENYLEYAGKYYFFVRSYYV